MREHLTEFGSTSDLDLVGLARIALDSAQFQTSIVELGGHQLLIADGKSTAVVIATTARVDQLLDIEPVAIQPLVERLGPRSVPDRRRDGYLFLLTTQPADASQAEALFSLTYNLRHVRRLIRVGVEPTAAGVARALRPVLPLVTRVSTFDIVNPILELEHRLIEDGLDPRIVHDAVDRFRSSDAASRAREAEDEVDADGD